MTNNLKNEKSSLRRLIIEKRKKLLPGDKRAWDEKICENLFSFFDFSKAGCVLCYNSLSQEVDTKEIARKLLEKGVRLYFPKTLDGGRMEFFEVKKDSKLEKGFMGVLEPDSTTERFEGEDAICIVPGLCFGKKGERLGYGAGYYDRYLDGKTMKKIALAYDCFISDEVPCSLHDIRMDYIITQNGVTDCAESREA